MAASPAMAAPQPKMTYQTTSTNSDNTVLSGGRISYELRVECSNIVPGDCVEPVISFPAPTNAVGDVVATDPQVDSQYVKSVDTSDPAILKITLNDLKPGDSRQLDVSWAIANFTVKPGEKLSTDPTVAFTFSGAVSDATREGDKPADITTASAPAISVSKTLLTPSSAAAVKPGSDATYQLSVCVPGDTEGMENLTHITMVDTLTDLKGRVSDANVQMVDGSSPTESVSSELVQVDGKNALRLTYNIDLDGKTLTRCGQSGEPVSRTVKIHYGDGILASASDEDPNPTNDVTNTLDATGVTISGATVKGSSTVKHAFAIPAGGSYGELIAITYKRTFNGTGSIGNGVTSANGSEVTTTSENGTKVGSVAATDDEKEWGWDLSGSWAGDEAKRPAYANEQRYLSYVDRLPCISGGEAKSPIGTNGNESYTSAWHGQNPYTFDADGNMQAWGLPNQDPAAPLCNNPAFDLDRMYFRNGGLQPTSITQVAAVQIVYLENGQHKTVIKNFPDGLSSQGKATNGKDYAYVYMFASTKKAGAPSFDLPDGAVVTDIAVTYKDVPNKTGGNNVALWGTSTKAFAESGLKVQTNTEAAIASNGAQVYGLPDGTGKTSAGLQPEQMKFVDSTVDMGISKKAAEGTDVSKLNLGDTASWVVKGSFNASTPERKVKPTMVDVLPAGLEYVAGSAKWSDLPDGVTAPGEPVIGTKSINGVDRTTLTWAFDQEFDKGDSATVAFDTLVTFEATAGSHSGDNAQYIGMFDQNGAIPGGSNATDKWDLNGDGSTSDRVAASSVTWTVRASSGASIEKYVKGSLGKDLGVDQKPSIGDDEWSRAGVSAAVTEGADGSQVDYRLKVKNNGTSKLKKTVVYDVLPYEGDTAIGKDLAGESRGSQFQVNFRELLGSLPDGVSIQYSTSNNPARPELGVTGGDDNWTSTLPSDVTTVRALKYTIDELTPGQELNLDYRGDIPAYVFGESHPAQKTGEDTQYAWNNLAFQTNTSEKKLLPAEAPKVPIRSVLGEIGDYAWFDANRNGIQDDGEKPAPGVVFQLVDGDGNDVKDANGNPVRATTDADGLYTFEVPIGTWSVKVIEVPAGYTLTAADKGSDDAKDSDASALNKTTDPVKITKDKLVDHTLDAGLIVPAVSVGDYVWFDGNGNGVQDSGEKGIKGVTLTLTDQDGNPVTDVNGNVVAAVTTDADGAYSFDLLPALTDGKSYKVHVDNGQDALKQYQPTKAGTGDDRAKDSATKLATTGETGQPALNENDQRDSSLDFGFVGKVTVGDYVWQDDDRDGIQDAGEPGIEGVQMKVYTVGSDGKLVEATYPDGTPVTPVRTDKDGKYLFEGLPTLPSASDKYVVRIDSDDEATAKILADYGVTKPAQGDDPEKDSSSEQAESYQDLTIPGSKDLSLDFGFIPQVKIGDFVWFDTNKDGIQDAGEPGISDVVLTVLGPDGKPAADIWGNTIESVKTNSDGSYLFEHLPVLKDGEKYTVAIDRDATIKINDKFANYGPTTSNAGGRDVDSDEWKASSEGLTTAGDEDLTLDFGFITPEPVVDIEKFDENGNDADTADESVPLPDGSAKLEFTVTNQGDEDLIDIKVSDELIKGSGKIENLQCVFPDGSKGTSWAGPFLRGASFDCSADLSGVKPGEAHVDRATVEGTGLYSGKPVTDHDDYNGHTPKPAIDIEKVDLAGNDADTAKDKVTVKGEKQNIKFIVTNTGDEALKNVSIADKVTQGGAKVENIVCVFPDGSKGTTWSGPFAVGDSFECTATINGLKAKDLHSDTATVHGTGVESGKDVSDSDPYYAIRNTSNLPFTGAQGVLIAGIAGLVLVAAGGTLAVSARKRED